MSTCLWSCESLPANLEQLEKENRNRDHMTHPYVNSEEKKQRKSSQAPKGLMLLEGARKWAQRVNHELYIDGIEIYSSFKRAVLIYNSKAEFSHNCRCSDLSYGESSTSQD